MSKRDRIVVIGLHTVALAAFLFVGPATWSFAFYNIFQIVQLIRKA
jgi:hypothetical protein